ncbi:MAG: hypothetical protein PVJ09_00350 [Candidatus Woesebacteria bacterium]|jgi:hypothetical protein
MISRDFEPGRAPDKEQVEPPLINDSRTLRGFLTSESKGQSFRVNNPQNNFPALPYFGPASNNPYGVFDKSRPQSRIALGTYQVLAIAVKLPVAVANESDPRPDHIIMMDNTDTYVVIETTRPVRDGGGVKYRSLRYALPRSKL